MKPTHVVDKNFELFHENRKCITSSPSSYEHRRFTEGDHLTVELQGGSLGDLYNIFNHSTGERTKVMEYSYSPAWKAHIKTI